MLEDIRENSAFVCRVTLVHRYEEKLPRVNAPILEPFSTSSCSNKKTFKDFSLALPYTSVSDFVTTTRTKSDSFWSVRYVIRLHPLLVDIKAMYLLWDSGFSTCYCYI